MLRVTTIDGSLRLDLKVVPGASRQRVIGLLGESLKVVVAAPPEGGAANEAVCDLLAATLGLPRGAVRVLTGHARPRKTVEIRGLDEAALRARLGVD